MKNKLLVALATVCLSLTACNSTEQTKDVQANEKKDNNVEETTKLELLVRKLKK